MFVLVLVVAFYVFDRDCGVFVWCVCVSFIALACWCVRLFGGLRAIDLGQGLGPTQS